MKSPGYGQLTSELVPFSQQVVAKLDVVLLLKVSIEQTNTCDMHVTHANDHVTPVTHDPCDPDHTS